MRIIQTTLRMPDHLLFAITRVARRSGQSYSAYLRSIIYQVEEIRTEIHALTKKHGEPKAK